LRRFDILVDRSDAVHSLLQHTGVSYLPLGLPAKYQKADRASTLYI
jgi:hypothetical protein